MPFGVERLAPELRGMLDQLERTHEDQVLVPIVQSPSRSVAESRLVSALAASAQIQTAFAAVLAIAKDATTLALTEEHRRNPEHPDVFRQAGAVTTLTEDVALLFDAALHARWQLASLLVSRPDLLLGLTRSGRMTAVAQCSLEADFALGAGRVAVARGLSVVREVGEMLGALALTRAREGYGIAAAPLYADPPAEGTDVGEVG